MRYLTGVVLSWSLVLASSVHGEVVLQDFANAARLELKGAGAVYRLQIPERVYAGVKRADLGDLRVFNAAGAVVPHELRLPPIYGPASETARSLPFFPLQDMRRDLDRLRLKLLHDGSSTRLEVDTGGVTQSASSGYLIDARQLTDPLRRLEINWQAPATDAGFLVHGTVAGSADLRVWRTVVADFVLADLRHLGQQFQHNRVELPGTKYRFYRLTFKDTDPQLRLSAVRGWSAKRSRNDRLVWRQVAVRAGEGAGEYRFDNLTGMHVCRVRIHLPEQNTLAGAILYSRRGAGSPWVRRLSTTLYRLAFPDGEVTHPDLILAGETDQQWRLTVDQGGGGLGSGLPEISTGYQPHELVFIARGEPPFALAWGSARVAAPVRSSANPFGRVPTSHRLVARLDDKVWHPGDGSPIAEPLDWRRYTLWGVLICGALLVVVLAVRLFSRIAKEGDTV